MRKTSVLLCFLISFSFSFSQSAKLPEVDKSPMDVSYYPNNYPILKIQNKATEPLVARILYSRPQKQGRKIFGELVEYGKVWRLGANEATEIELFKDVKIGNSKLKKGRYTMYAIPYETKWTVIFNKENDTWGAFKYDAKKDVLRFDVTIQKLPESAEVYTMYFEKATGGASLIISWEDVKTTIPFSF